MAAAAAAAAPMGPAALRGYTCNVCGAAGQHYATECPLRRDVGLPKALQALRESAAGHPANGAGLPLPSSRRTSTMSDDTSWHGGASASGAASVDGADNTQPNATATSVAAPLTSFLASAELPGDFLPETHLVNMASRAPDVPPALRCYACYMLALDNIWCSCCDVVACAACLQPLDAAPRCPSCMTTCEDAFHIVGPLRVLAHTWARLRLEATDPYCASSDEEMHVALHLKTKPRATSQRH